MTAEPSLQTVSRAKSAENRVLIAQLMAKINDGREAEVLADCEALSREEEDHPVVLYGLAVLAYQHGQIKTAVEALTRAHERDAYEPLHTEMLAVLYAMAGNLADATYFAKLSVTRQIDEVTLALLPSSLPPFAQSLSLIKTKPLLSSAEALEAARAYGAAAELYERHLVFFSGDAVAVRGFARCLLGAGRGGQALDVLSDLPDGDAAAANASLIGSAYAAVGEAAAAAAHHAQALAAAPDDIGIGCAALCDAVFAPGATAAGLAAANAAWAATLPARDAPPAEPLPGPPVSVGYLVSGSRDIRDLAVVAALVSAMDNRRFKPTFYGYRPNDDPLNAVLRHCAGQWRDISECDPYTLAAIVEGDGIDVLVDVGGHGAPNHLAALALRAAPWQVSWLGNPGSLGLGALDAEFVDEHELSGGAGGVLRPLLHGLYCRDLLPPPRRPRRDRPVTFGADVAVAQLHPELLTAWAEIFARVPGAVLALRDHGFLEAGLIEPLSRRFQDAGLSERVDVITGDPAAFYEQVDVALTPFVEVNPHSSIEALSQGVPVLALAGAGRQRRQSAALLRRNGLAAFVFDSEAGYVAEAVRLGLSAEARAAADAAVAVALAGAPLFRPDRVAAGFAAALEALVGLGAAS